MIVKVMVHDLENKYWMFDKIDRIVVKNEYQFQTREEVQKWHEEYNFMDAPLYEIPPADKKGPFTIIVLGCRMKDDEYYIGFDKVAYICNDEGKTIEKIVALI